MPSFVRVPCADTVNNVRHKDNTRGRTYCIIIEDSAAASSIIKGEDG